MKANILTIDPQAKMADNSFNHDLFNDTLPDSMDGGETTADCKFLLFSAYHFVPLFFSYFLPHIKQYQFWSRYRYFRILKNCFSTKTSYTALGYTATLIMPSYIRFTVDLAPTSPTVVRQTNEVGECSRSKPLDDHKLHTCNNEKEPEVIPPTPLKQTCKNKQTISAKTTDQAPKTKLNATQSSVLKRLVTLERSKLYHQSKSKEFTRHTTKHKQPDFTYPHTEISYTNDFSSESHEKYKQIKRKFQIDMCELLAQHHKEKAEEASAEVESLLLRAEMAYNDTPELMLLKKSYKTMAIEKFIAKKPSKNNKKRGVGGANQAAESCEGTKRQKRQRR